MTVVTITRRRHGYAWTASDGTHPGRGQNTERNVNVLLANLRLRYGDELKLRFAEPCGTLVTSGQQGPPSKEF